MLPVTLGLGLINFNARRRHALRVAPDRPGARADRDRQGVPHLHAPAGDVLGRGRDRALPVALAARRARRHRRLPRTPSALGLRQIAFLLVPASVDLAPCSPSRSCASSTSAAQFDADQTPVVAGALAAFSLGLTFNGAMLMLNRAFFSLQSTWVPTAVALGNLGAQRRCSTPSSTASASGGSRSRPRSSTSPAPPRCSSLLRRRLGPHRARRDRGARPARIVAGLGRARRRRLRRLARPRRRRSAARSARRSSRSASRSAAARGRLPGSRAGRCGFASSRRCSPCGRSCVEPRMTLRLSGRRRRRRRTMDQTSADPQLLDHRAHRPRQVDARRPHPRADRHASRAARCATRCSTRWTSSASAGSRSRRRPCA